MKKQGKIKAIPIFICLLASFMTCIISIMQKVSFKTFVIRFVVVSLIFYIIGALVKFVAFKFFVEVELKK